MDAGELAAHSKAERLVESSPHVDLAVSCARCRCSLSLSGWVKIPSKKKRRLFCEARL